MHPTPVGAAFLATHLLGCSILWASGFLLMKLVPDIRPVALAACRGLIAAAALSAWFVVRRETILPRGREWRDWAVLGTLNGWGPNILVATALAEIGAGLAAMIQAAGPLVVAVLAHLLFADERLDARRAGGILVGFVGVAVLIGPTALPSNAASLSGALLMLVVTTLYALGNVYVRFVPGAAAARLALGQQMVSGAGARARLRRAARVRSGTGARSRPPRARRRRHGDADRAVHAPDPGGRPDPGRDRRLPPAGLDRPSRLRLSRRDGFGPRGFGRRDRSRRSRPRFRSSCHGISRLSASRIAGGIATGHWVVRST